MISTTSRLALTAAGLALAALAAPLAAQDRAARPAAGTFTIDPAHSSVEFTIRHLVARVPGRFNTVSGTLRYDPANLAATSVQAEIDAASIHTANERRDGHLRSADFFEVEKHPKITFKSTSVARVDDTHARLIGDLTIRGVTKPVTLDVELLGMGKGTRGETRAGFTARGRVKRTDYGVVWNRALEGGGTLLGDDVDLVLNVSAIQQTPEDQASKD